MRKRTLRNLDGSIRDLLDETNGGYIIKNGIVVNQERYDELRRIEEDKRKAALAQNFAAPAPSGVDTEQRNAAPGKLVELEKKVNSMESNIAEILKLLKK